MAGVDQAALWTHVAELRPALRQNVRVYPQTYRNERWYVLHDESAGRFLRFNGSAYEVLGRLDGELTLDEILEQANLTRPEQPLTADDVLQIVAQLQAAEVLCGGLPSMDREVLERFRSSKGRRRRALMNPLALRIPLFDPDRLLEALVPIARPLFSERGVLLWFAVVVAAGTVVLAHLDTLLADIRSIELAPAQLMVFWLVFPLIKALHELGHGLAVKAWGGEVHETGVTLLVFIPIPYVDASAAWAFRDKRRRAAVGAAGILVELFLAAAGALVWVMVEPGVVRDVALSVALVGGVSTLLFNGNPLLRFDGYYVLEDLVEIPNLGQRAGRYYLYLIQRYLFGVADARSPVTARGERRWFAFYGLASPLYRLSVLVAIALFLAEAYLFAGVVLALWAVATQVLRPLARGLAFIAVDPRLRGRRPRALIAAALAAAGLGGVLAMPLPLVTHAEGVVWLREGGKVMAGSDGFIHEVLVPSGAQVKAGTPLLRLANLQLDTRRAVLEGRLAELESTHWAERGRSRVQAGLVKEDIAAAQAELDQVTDEIGALIVTSTTAGRFVMERPDAVLGRYVRQGDLVGYVVDEDHLIVRAVVGQDRIGLLRSRSTTAEVAFAHRLGDPVATEVVAETPAGSAALPSRALGAAGGGEVAVDGAKREGTTATERVFQLDLALPPGLHAGGIGGRAYVRLHHGREALWAQWSRSGRQLVLSRLGA